MSNPKNLALQTGYQLHAVFADEIEVDESYFGGTRKVSVDVDRKIKVPEIGLRKGWQGLYEDYCFKQYYLICLLLRVK